MCYMPKILLILTNLALLGLLHSCQTYKIAEYKPILQRHNDSSSFHIRNDSLFFKNKNLSRGESAIVWYRGIKYQFLSEHDYGFPPEPPDTLYTFECTIMKTPWNKRQRSALEFRASLFRSTIIRYETYLQRQ